MRERRGELFSAVLFHRGGQVVVRVAPGVVFLRLEGLVPQEAVAPAIHVIDETIRRDGRVVCYCDGATWKTYEREFRQRWTVYFLEHRDHMLVHIHVPSPVVRVGVQFVLGLVPGIFRVHSSREAFYALLRAAAPGADAAADIARAEEALEALRADAAAPAG